MNGHGRVSPPGSPRSAHNAPGGSHDVMRALGDAVGWRKKGHSSSFSPRVDGPGDSALRLAQSWVPDALAPRCYQCKKDFSGLFAWGTTRRHHCRSCGNCFCAACSKNMVETNSGTMVRVCDVCFKEYQERKQDLETGNTTTRGGMENTQDCLSRTDSESTGGYGAEEHFEVVEEEDSPIEVNHSISEALSKLLLLPKERVVGSFEDIRFEYTYGQVIVTTFQLVLVDHSSKGKGRRPIQIPLHTIERLEISLSDEYEAGVIDVFCKSFRFVRLAIFQLVSDQRFGEFHHLENCIANLAFPQTSTPFTKRFVSLSDPPTLAPGALAGFSSCCFKQHFDDLEEISRVINDSPDWRVSQANATFGLCASYPRFLVVPSSVSDRELFEVAAFRSRHRIPMLSWVDPKTKVALARSSQPKVGLLRGRSAADEKLLAAIARNGGSGLVIIDARPLVNATVNKVTMSGGFEDVTNYDAALRRMCAKQRHGSISLEFMDVQNTSSVRVSATKLKSLIGYKLKRPPRYPSLSTGGLDRPKSFSNMLNYESEVEDNDFEINWLQKFAESRWLEHLGYILKATVRVVRLMKIKRQSVLVHCSDGWDRTSQVTSLAMLCMDEHYRTIKGFVALIEKEWIAAGHPFRRRLGTGQPASGNAAKGTVEHSSHPLSPIFLQFIECVWQIGEQFPTAFEFTEDLLILILDRLYDGRHGTFLVENRREVVQYNFPYISTCVWDEVLSRQDEFKNAQFQGSTEALLPAFSTKVLQFWQGYYLRFDDSCIDETAEEKSHLDAYSATKPSNLSQDCVLTRSGSVAQRQSSVAVPQSMGTSPTAAFCAEIVNHLVLSAELQAQDKA